MTAHEARNLSEAAEQPDDDRCLAAALEVIRAVASLGKRAARVPHPTGCRGSSPVVNSLRGLGYVVGPVISHQAVVLVTW